MGESGSASPATCSTCFRSSISILVPYHLTTLPSSSRNGTARTRIGNISELHAIAQELILGDPQQAYLGHRIARLVNQFEFDAIERLASGGQIGDGPAAE
jgi:hypothetical protein